MNAQFTYYPEQMMLHMNEPHIMGTKFDMLIIGKEQSAANAIAQDALIRLKEIEQIANRFDSNSEVAKVNAAEPVSRLWVSPEFKRMIDLCRDYRERTEGLFDITLGQTPLPQFDHDGAMVISQCGCHVDFGGFAKGYALREITTLLHDNSVDTAYIDFGNSAIMALGSHPHGDCWRVSIPDPFTGREIQSVGIKDASLSISGNTPHYNTHILNPATGEYINAKRISAVIAASALDAEVLSTTWMIANDEQRRSIAGKFEIINEFVYYG